jgi:hypothetical protein
MRPVVIALSAAVALASSAWARERPPNAATAYAAARIWGYVMKVEATLGLCRELDSTDATTYDRLYDDFYSGVAPTMARIKGILIEEAIRSGYSPDTIMKRLDPSMSRLVAKERAESNPSRFIAECRDWNEIPAEQELRTVDPADM